MNRDSMLSVIRHLITCLGGGLVTNGLANQDELGQLAGAVVTIIGIVWGILDKRSRAASAVWPPQLGGPLAVPALLALVGTLAFTGCSTPSQGAYRSIASTATLVDGAMNGWGDWVRAGKATASDEAAVRELYADYQLAMRLARKTVTAFERDPETTRSDFDRALDALDASTADLLELIMKLSEKR